MNILIKWFLVVWLNSILGFFLGYQGNGELYLTGMILGVMTWYIIYVVIDYLLRAYGREKESRRLFLSALIRIPLQIGFISDFYSGFAAVFTLELLGLNTIENKLLDAYTMTFFTGFYLSLFCSVIFLLVTLVGNYLEPPKKSIDNR